LELARSQIVSSSRAIASYSGIDNLDEACGCFPDLVFCMIRGQGACATRNVFQDNVAFGISGNRNRREAGHSKGLVGDESEVILAIEAILRQVGCGNKERK
jgi:hypothetical protein